MPAAKPWQMCSNTAWPAPALPQPRAGSPKPQGPQGDSVGSPQNGPKAAVQSKAATSSRGRTAGDVDLDQERQVIGSSTMPGQQQLTGAARPTPATPVMGNPVPEPHGATNQPYTGPMPALGVPASVPGGGTTLGSGGAISQAQSVTLSAAGSGATLVGDGSASQQTASKPWSRRPDGVNAEPGLVLPTACWCLWPCARMARSSNLSISSAPQAH